MIGSVERLKKFEAAHDYGESVPLHSRVVETRWATPRYGTVISKSREIYDSSPF